MPGTSARHRRDVLNLAAQFATQVKKKRDVLIELNQQTESLTKKDIATWRQAWQAAINYEQPNRCALLDVYNDALVDLHLSGCIAQRKGKTLQKTVRPHREERQGGRQSPPYVRARVVQRFPRPRTR